MSRRANNLKRMKAAKRRRQQAREFTAQAAGHATSSNQRGNEMHEDGERTTGSVVVIDKFSGEVREGGPELHDEMNATLAREREEFLSSKNPCYLVGRVKQNGGAFRADEIKRMVDATFECICHDSPDAWYPNQYALSLAHATKEDAALSIAYFLNNFKLGLQIGGERAARHRGHGDGLGEFRQLAARLDEPDGLEELGPADLLGIVAYVVAHPRYAEAMSWYAKGSGSKMDRRNYVRAVDVPGLMSRRVGHGQPVGHTSCFLLASGKNPRSEDAVRSVEPNPSRPPNAPSHTHNSSAYKSMFSQAEREHLESLPSEHLEAQGRSDMLTDVALWTGLVKSKGRDAVIDELVRGNICTWLESDGSHKLFIKASNGAEARVRLRPYTDDELGEWFSLMTMLVLAQTDMQVGVQWKEFGRNDPVLLIEYPPLHELRRLLPPG